MNIMEIVNLCKKQKMLYLHGEEGGTQWISDGFAIYPLLGAPHFTEDSIRATYNLPANVKVKAEPGLPFGLDFRDVVSAENQVFFEKIQLSPGNANLVSLRTKAGVTYIDRRYLTPVDDGAPAIGIYERITRSGQLYIAVKRGMMVEALIMPVVNVIKEDWLEDLKELLGVLQTTFNQGDDRE